MAFSIKGYILEKPRVGSSNSPFTATPDNLISDSGAFDAAYPSTEANPRTEYFVFVEPQDGNLPVAEFSWSKNEVLQRFDYDGMEQRFKLLPGGPLDVSKALVGPNANTTSPITVPTPFSSDTVSYPFRVAVGTIGSGVTLATIFVVDDASFGSPPPVGTVKVSLTTGTLFWNAADLVTYEGEAVRAQRQTFFALKDSKGGIGTVDDSALLLNPIPKSGEIPRVRLGYGFPLTPIEVASEGLLTPSPPAGSFKWAVDTGKIALNPSDVAANPGKTVYYEGVLFVQNIQLPSQTLGLFPTGPSLVAISIYPFGEVEAVFRVGSYQFPEITYVSAFSSDPADITGKKGVVQVLVSGLSAQARFSTADIAAFQGQSLLVTFGDLLIERGVTLRFYRNPVNLDGSDPTLKDVTSVYAVTDAIISSPIIGSPQFYIPALPIDQTGYTLTVKVEQGTGTYTSNNFPRLDVASPPAGFGYYIDFEGRMLHLAQRKNQAIIPIPQSTGALALPDPLVLTGNAVLELETSPGSNVYTTLISGTDYLLEPLSGTVSFIETDDTLVSEGSQGSYAASTFTDTTADFVSEGVQAGDLILVGSGVVFKINTVTTTTLGIDAGNTLSASAGTYEIRRGQEILIDRYFQEVILSDPATKVERIRKIGAPTNSPRFTVSLDQVPRTRFRFDVGTFSTSVTLIPSTGTFTAPSSLLQGQVEIKVDTGEINFSQIDVTGGSLVYQVLQLQQQVDYKISPVLGFIDYDQRALSYDEGLLTYKPLSTITDTNSVGTVVQEPVTWLVRKEVTQPHPDPASTLNFNPTNRTVASDPVPNVFRGGRPQVLGDQFTVASGPPSTITFLSDMILSDALPHGAIIDPTERVYIDYYVTQAFGGEKSTSVLNPPMVMAQLSIKSGSVQSGTGTFAGTTLTDTTSDFVDALVSVGDSLKILTGPSTGERHVVLSVSTTTLTFQTALGTSGVFSYQVEKATFTLLGDWTLTFKANYLLRIEQEEVYLLASSIYDSTSQMTTVALVAPQVFQSDYTSPRIYLSSGDTPILPTSLIPSYFLIEAANYSPLPRGTNKITLTGDRTPSYKTGEIVMLTDPTPSFLDFYQVTGAAFDGTKGTTEVTLGTSLRREYTQTGGAILKHSVRPVLEGTAAATTTNLAPVLTSDYQVYRKVAGQPGSLLASPLDFTIDDSGKIKFTQALQPGEEIGIFYTGHNFVQAGINLRASYTSAIIPTSLNGILNQSLRFDYTLYSPDTWYYRVETLTNYRGELAQEYEGDAKASSPSGGPNTSNATGQNLFDQGRPSLFFNEGKYSNEDIVARGSLKWYNDTTNILEDVLEDVDGRVVGNTSGRFKFDGTTGQLRNAFADAENQIDDTLKISDAPYTITFPPFAVTSIGTYLSMWQASGTSRFYPTKRQSVGVIIQGQANGDTIFDLQVKKVSSVTGLQQRPAFALVTADAAIGVGTLAVDNANGSADGVRPAFTVGMKVIVEAADGTVLLPSSTEATVSAVTATSITFAPTATVAIPAGATALQSNESIYTSFQYGVDGDKGVLTFVKAPDGLPSPLDQLFTPIPGGTPAQCVTVYSNLDTSPARPPAMDGGTLDDDGTLHLPLQSPSLDAEDVLGGSDGTRATELGLIASSPTGTLRAATQASYEGLGSLDVTRTLLTATASFSSPVPQVYDLVRILGGLNGATSFRRITAVTSNSVTVDTPFSTQDTGFNFTITVSPGLHTGTGSFVGTTLTDVLANFASAGVLPGHTVVVTSGASIGERRQIVTVSTTTLTFAGALTASGVYRIDNALGTYNGPLLTELTSTVTTSLAILDTNTPPSELYSERNGIEAFFEQCFTDLVPTGTGNAGTTTLVDVSASFLGSDISNPTVKSSDFVFVRSGGAQGIFKITSVDSNTQITITGSFPAVDPAATYRVVSSFGVGYDSLSALFTQLVLLDSFITGTSGMSTAANQVQVVTPGPVVDANAYANALLTSTLDSRVASIAGRDPTALITAATNVLTGSDRLYDKRFTWIDARINLEKGILPLQAQAVQARQKAQADILKSLTKLLAVQ